MCEWPDLSAPSEGEVSWSKDCGDLDCMQQLGFNEKKNFRRLYEVLCLALRDHTFQVRTDDGSVEHRSHLT